jgi:hypothetical protein
MLSREQQPQQRLGKTPRLSFASHIHSGGGILRLARRARGRKTDCIALKMLQSTGSSHNGLIHVWLPILPVGYPA